MTNTYLDNLQKPIIGLSPMDGVTDAPFRQITAEVGKPAIIFTEFVSVEGLARNAVALLSHLRFSQSERPIIAQLYGIEPASFRVATVMACLLGFDGIDINMGCPAKKVSRRGAGAALINNHELAGEIIQACHKGLQDFAQGQQLKDLPLKEKMKKEIQSLALKNGVKNKDLVRRVIPLSVKTRIGYDRPVVKEWFSFLAKQNLAMISIHGRTLKQMYSGQSDWSEIAQAATIIKKKSKALVLGNGDINTRDEALSAIDKFGVDGVLIGRAALGNPWVFLGHKPTIVEKKEMAIRHAKLYEKIYPPAAFVAFRRHLAAYIKDIEGAAKLRSALMQTTNAKQVASNLSSLDR